MRSASAPAERKVLRIAPLDLGRAIYIALQARGAALGVAEAAANMVVFAQGCGQDALDDLLAALPGGTKALLAAPAALDLACARGMEVVANVDGPFFLGEAAVRAAERGYLGLAVWKERTGKTGCALAGPSEAGPWFACSSKLDAGIDAINSDAARTIASLTPGSFAIMCMPARNCESVTGKMDVSWNSAELAKRRTAWQRAGLSITREQFDALSRAAADLWVLEGEEHRLRPNESTDALKLF